MYAKLADAGFVRVSHHAHNPGIRMPIADLIRGLARRGASR